MREQSPGSCFQEYFAWFLLSTCEQKGQRTDLLAEHLVVGRLVLSDYNDTSVITTMAGRNITLLPTPAG